MRRALLSIAALTLVGLLIPSSFESYQAHSGRTNSEGCHNNRRTGDYHCHNSGTPSSANSQPAPLERPNSAATFTLADDAYWRVRSVGDGDTLRVAKGDEVVTIRLGCIDAPEMAQDYGQEAKDQLQALLPVSTPITWRTIDTDRYGRTVAEVFSEGININLSLIESGHAVAYRRYLDSCDHDAFLEAESRAREGRLVFWSLENPVMPWDFRQWQRRQ